MNREKITGIFLFGLGLAIFLKSLAYPLGTLRRPGGGLFPLIASLFLMVLSTILAVQAFRGREVDASARTPFFPEKESPRKILLGFASLLGYRYLLPVIGFGPSTAVFIFFLSRFLGKYGWGASFFFSAVTGIVAYYLFQVWLKVPMPRPIFGF